MTRRSPVPASCVWAGELACQHVASSRRRTYLLGVYKHHTRPLLVPQDHPGSVLEHLPQPAHSVGGLDFLADEGEQPRVPLCEPLLCLQAFSRPGGWLRPREQSQQRGLFLSDPLPEFVCDRSF